MSVRTAHKVLKAMIPRGSANIIMDALEEAGAQDILVTAILNCRV
jgi:ATP phosphoribosyltransferase